jgi:hypothetical protein
MLGYRFVLPDVLKGFAVLMMIQVHLTELFAVPSFYAGSAGKISLFLGGVPAAPLFMAAMGFFIGYGKIRNNRPDETETVKVGKSVLRGIKLILLGFILNIGLNLHLFYKIYTGTFQLDPLPYLFGADILFMAGIAIIVIPLVMKVFRNSAVALIVIALLITVLSDILPLYNGNSTFIKYLMVYIHSNEWWSYFPVFPWLAYPFLGAALGRMYVTYPDILQKAGKNVFVFFAAFIPFIIFARDGFSISSYLPAYYHHGIVFFFWAVLFMVIITIGTYNLLRFITPNNIVVKYLAWTGKNVTAFYIIQWLIIGNIATAIYKTQEAPPLILWFIGITAVVSGLVWLWVHRRAT